MFTPAKYIEAARLVMDGIDLDPASCETAQATIKAASYFTKRDNALSKEWPGRVWLNPPYSQPFMTNFVDALVRHVASGKVTDAI